MTWTLSKASFPYHLFPLGITHLKSLCHHALCFLLTLRHTVNDFGNCWSPLLTIAHIKIRLHSKMKNDTPFMTAPCNGMHLPHWSKSITANGINYISTLQNRCKCTKFLKVGRKCLKDLFKFIHFFILFFDTTLYSSENKQKIEHIQKFKSHNIRNNLLIYGTIQYRCMSRLLKILVWFIFGKSEWIKTEMWC